MIDYEKYVVHGKNRTDLTLLYRDALTFNSAVKAMAEPFRFTGAQLKASISLLEKMGSKVFGATCYSMNVRVKADPFFASYKLHSLLTSER